MHRVEAQGFQEGRILWWGLSPRGSDAIVDQGIAFANIGQRDMGDKPIAFRRLCGNCENVSRLLP